MRLTQVSGAERVAYPREYAADRFRHAREHEEPYEEPLRGNIIPNFEMAGLAVHLDNRFLRPLRVVGRC